jgi:hypothetical protein
MVVILITAMNAFAGLVISLPTRDSTVRMRVWRALKGTGCGVLRDGLYVLPREAPTTAGFTEVEEQVRAAGGFAAILDMGFRPGADLEHARGLFDRSADYGRIVVQLKAAKPAIARLGARKAQTLVQRLRRSLDELANLDFFPGQAQRQARDAMQALESHAHELYADGEPRKRHGKLGRVDASKYRARLWATRKAPWIDRLASAWLIKRFIDPDARFAWIDTPRDCPKKAVGFDYDGAQFTHVGNRVTFEVLLASFALESDPALAAIASAVHFLDAGGIPVADAKGLETVLRGVREKARGDDEALAKACGVFDYLYAAYMST